MSASKWNSLTIILYPDPCVPREAPVKKCSYKKVHVPTQELLHRKKCLLPDSKPESAGKLVLILDLDLISTSQRQTTEHRRPRL